MAEKATGVQGVLHDLALQLDQIDWTDPLNRYVRADISPLAEAVINLFVVVFYQAETGLATLDDFSEAKDLMRVARLH